MKTITFFISSGGMEIICWLFFFFTSNPNSLTMIDIWKYKWKRRSKTRHIQISLESILIMNGFNMCWIVDWKLWILYGVTRWHITLGCLHRYLKGACYQGPQERTWNTFKEISKSTYCTFLKKLCFSWSELELFKLKEQNCSVICCIIWKRKLLKLKITIVKSYVNHTFLLIIMRL